MDADAISNVVIVAAAILSGIWTIYQNKYIDERLTSYFFDSYQYMYIFSIPICIIVTLLFDFNVASIFAIAIAGAIVIIFPAFIIAIVRFLKRKRK